jgi:cell wall-associated NlpC family hydrolase
MTNRFRQLLLFSFLLSGLSSCHVFGPATDYQTSHSTRDPRVKKDSEAILREDIATDAQKHIGTKYRYAGKTPGGFDCSGFVYFVMKENDVSVSGYSAAQEKDGRPIKVADARPGDLIFFRRSRAGKVFHVAMVLENNRGDLTLIHSTSSRGVVIDDLATSSYWNSKVMTARDVVNGR